MPKEKLSFPLPRSTRLRSLFGFIILAALILLLLYKSFIDSNKAKQLLPLVHLEDDDDLDDPDLVSPTALTNGTGEDHHPQADHIGKGNNRTENTDSDKNVTVVGRNLTHEIHVMNLMGSGWTTFDLLKELLGENANRSITGRMSKTLENIKNTSAQRSKVHGVKLKTKINVGAIACGKRRAEFLVMAKSAVMFSQDAALHFIVFSDNKTILDVAQDLLELKWTVNSLGWDFTYELHLEWWPDTSSGWRDMYQPCATQRLFFPELLQHIDSLIYLDSDTIVVSNMTYFWKQFEKMGQLGLASMAANTEDSASGWYNENSTLPFYGKRGVNAGVMLMNLTRMRSFNFQGRSMAAKIVYKEKIWLADQDIINIIFHTYPERMALLECSFNFNWVHCGLESQYLCYKDGVSFCFCKPAISFGVRVVHGNSGTFHMSYFRFLDQIYKAFKEFNFLMDTPAELIQRLKREFDTAANHCGPLTSQILYGNAEDYLQRLKLNAGQ